MSRRVALALFVSLAWAWPAPAQAPATGPYLDIPEGGGPIDEGPIPDGLTSVDARACGECHEAAFREWDSSRHHSAYTNAIFQAEFRPRRRPFCSRCHAPLTRDPEAEPELAADGIDCAVCHVRNGAVLNPTVSGRAPHRSVVAPEIAQPLACARCHDFAPEHTPDALLQSTLHEWNRSTPGREGQSCQSCHLPRVGRRHRHDMPGGRDRRLLRDALTVEGEARRVDDVTRVRLTLTANDVGHAVPTGDVFRRLEVEAWIAGQPDTAQSEQLMRRFLVRGREWRVVADERVPPPGEGSREVELELPGTGRRVRWRVRLWFVSERTARRGRLDDLYRDVATGSLRITR